MKKYLALTLLFISLLFSIHSFTRTKNDNNGQISDLRNATPKIKTYQIAVGDSYANLEVKVNYAISQGWQPIGGLTIVNSDFAQVLVK